MSFKTPLGKTIFETKPISAGCEFVSGYAFKSKDFSESGYPVIKIKNIQNKQVTLNGDNQFIPKNVITEKLNKFKLTHGDILIAMTGQGSVGRVGKLVLNDKQVTPYLNQRVGKFVPHHNVLDKDYLYYIISTSAYEGLLFAAGSGSGQPNLSPSVIKGVEIPFPPIKVQESISKILRDLDEKIVTNVQMNQTLEEMAQAIFQSWFVDFDPVKAKMNGEQPEGMDAATASLFPEKLVESELGLIPDGWDAGTLSDIAKYCSARISIDSICLDNYISTENMLADRKGVTAASKLPTAKMVAAYKTGDILVSNIRPYFKKIWLAEGNGGRSNDVLGFESSAPNTDAYIMNLLYQDTFFEYMTRTSKGAKMPRGDKTAIMNWEIAVPPVELREAYSAIVDKFYKLIPQNRAQNETLESLRDTLLPKLLSGEIELSR